MEDLQTILEERQNNLSHNSPDKEYAFVTADDLKQVGHLAPFAKKGGFSSLYAIQTPH